MKITIVGILFFVFHTAYTQTNMELIPLLDSMIIADQKWRVIARKVRNNELDPIPLNVLTANIKQADSLHFPIVKNLFEKFGFLGYDKVGKTGSHHFWTLVQHQDKHPKFQRKVLLQMKKEVLKNNASSLDYAYLVDRVRINKHRRQVYGTQIQLNEDANSYEPKPVVRPQKLNTRRKKVRLPSIEFYLKAINERYWGTLKD
jgi:hypothetical protein